MNMMNMMNMTGHTIPTRVRRVIGRVVQRAALSLSVAAVVTLTIVAQKPAGVDPSRDSRLGPPATGAGQISGVLLADDQTQQPVRHAWVTVAGVDFPTSKMAFTDDAGKWVVSDLAAGRYTVTATKPSYVRVAYGAKRFDRPGTPVTHDRGPARRQHHDEDLARQRHRRHDHRCTRTAVAKRVGPRDAIPTSPHG